MSSGKEKFSVVLKDGSKLAEVTSNGPFKLAVFFCNVFVGKMTIKAAKRIFNSGKICRSYSDLNFGVTFLEHSVCVLQRHAEVGTRLVR